MTKVKVIAPEFVESFPAQFEQGTLYVSAAYSSAAHLCACGCGTEVITPLSPAQWVLKFDGKVSLWPSIGSWTLPCQSHYVIDRGQIVWARSFTQEQVARNRATDQKLLEQSRVKRPWWKRTWS